ncbi:MAG: dual specificity protein phosphatase [Coleofasciculus sp. C1-SOL-03]|uniref:protein-tyrosine phosphatase family protein n=1 Tax=Coleofasciculus sp. C1-SOL-03 TaxID=3069522 RepID=UPI0032F9D4E7
MRGFWLKQPNIVSHYIPVEDGQPLPFEQLKSGIEFVRQEKAKSKTVLIVCGAGISRSSLFAVATLKEEENLSLLDAFRQVQIKHPQANPHPNLVSYHAFKLGIDRTNRLGFKPKEPKAKVV